MMKNYKENKPTADVLMSSMRAMGYSFEAAIADIIDNSISVQAKRIDVKFPINPSDIYIAICDDGKGMTKEELFDAMKYGSALKRGKRSEDDLGRFGLGLKAASLSQCRRLTVASKKENAISAYIWDLDVVEEKQDWLIIECTDEEIKNIKFIDYLDQYDSGTVVLWEDFDIIREASGNEYAELLGYQNSTADYLSLIFHRFLNKQGSEKLTIKINNFTLVGFDPFLEYHPKTTVRKSFTVPVKDKEGIERQITVQPYILPFQKDLSAEDKKNSGGIENYRSKQGFFIYRNERLIVWGTWFGRHRDELTKYARIKVDIPNTLDEVWGIDIKKQNARIPSSVRQRLNRAVDDAMDVAVRKQTYRGRISKIDDNIDYIWDRNDDRGTITYHINRESKIFDLIRDKVDDETWNYIDMVLEEIENSVPYQQIYIDKSQNKVNEDIDDERKAEIADKARVLIAIALKTTGDNKEDIIDRLLLSEPFNKYPELKEILLGE
ncbi:MAG: ATP-binding protein [Clostridia bacterium]|nr:ATP-binding protein [Clostridia bacterium]